MHLSTYTNKHTQSEQVKILTHYIPYTYPPLWRSLAPCFLGACVVVEHFIPVAMNPFRMYSLNVLYDRTLVGIRLSKSMKSYLHSLQGHLWTLISFPFGHSIARNRGREGLYQDLRSRKSGISLFAKSHRVMRKSARAPTGQNITYLCLIAPVYWMFPFCM